MGWNEDDDDGYGDDENDNDDGGGDVNSDDHSDYNDETLETLINQTTRKCANIFDKPGQISSITVCIRLVLIRFSHVKSNICS